MNFSKLLNLSEKLKNLRLGTKPQFEPKEDLVEAVDVLHPETGEWCKMLPDGKIVEFDDYASAVCVNQDMIKHRKYIMQKDGLENMVPEGKFLPNVAILNPMENQIEQLERKRNGYYSSVDAFEASRGNRPYQ